MPLYSILWSLVLIALGVSPSWGDVVAYVANTNEGSASIVGLETGAVLDTIEVTSGVRRTSVSADGEEIYVASPTTRVVQVIDVASSEVSRSLTFEEGWIPIEAVANSEGTLLHVVGSWPTGVASGVVIDTATWESPFQYDLSPGLLPKAVAVNPRSGFVYTVMEDRQGEFPPCAVDIFCMDELIAVDPTPGGGKAEIVLGNRIGDLYVTEDGNRLYVVHHIVEEGLSRGVLSVFDTSGGDVAPVKLDQIELTPPEGVPGPEGRRGRTPRDIAVDEDRNLLYVTHGFGDYIGIVDLTAREVVDTIALGEFCHGIDLSPDGQRAVVALTRSSTVVVVDLVARTVGEKIEVGRSPLAGGAFIVERPEPTPASPTPTLQTPTAGPTIAPACVSDCDGDRAVSVAEIVTSIGIALGSALLEVCPAADADEDGAVGVNELIQAVVSALEGCEPGSSSGP